MIGDLHKITIGELETSLLQSGRELFLLIFAGFFTGFMIWLELEFGVSELLLSWLFGWQ